MEVAWEEVEQSMAGYLWRAKIFGGWLVKDVSDVTVQVPESYGSTTSFRNEHNFEWRTSITFVPDPKHEWK